MNPQFWTEPDSFINLRGKVEDAKVAGQPEALPKGVQIAVCDVIRFHFASFLRFSQSNSQVVVRNE